MRIMAPHAILYTEMQTPGAILNKPERALYHHAIEAPLALQLGGSDAMLLAQCARNGEVAGFQEINLNLGCPSDKVQQGQFGACLMAHPNKVSLLIKAMKGAVCVPVSAKIRLGYDEVDDFDSFKNFALLLVESGVDKLIVHARKAWLNGLSPKQNREIPPLNYDFVYQLKSLLPDLPVIINGGITQIKEVTRHLQHLDGVMLGRLACQNPYAIAMIHHQLYPKSFLPSRVWILTQYLAHIMPEWNVARSKSLLLKPIYQLAHGLPGANRWRHSLNELQANAATSSQLEGLVQQLTRMEMAEATQNSMV